MELLARLIPLVLTIMATATLCLGCANQSHPSIVSSAFITALAENRRDDLLSLTTPEAEQLVQDWLDTHSPFDCQVPFGDWENERVEAYSTDGDTPADSPIIYDAIYSCYEPDSHRIYVLMTYHITLVWKEDKWQIKSWRDTCEADDYGVCPPGT